MKAKKFTARAKEEETDHGPDQGVSPLRDSEQYLTAAVRDWISMDRAIRGIESVVGLNGTPFLKEFYQSSMEKHAGLPDYIGLSGCLFMLDTHFHILSLRVPEKLAGEQARSTFTIHDAKELRGKVVSFSDILERFLNREKIHDQEKRETYSFLNRLLKEFTDRCFEELDKRSATGDLVAVFDLVSEPLRYKIRLVLNALEQRVKEIPEPEGEVQKFALEFLRQILSGADVELTVGVFLSNILEQIETALPVGRRHLVSVVRKLALEE